MRAKYIVILLIVQRAFLFTQALLAQDKSITDPGATNSILINSNDVAGVAVRRTVDREWVRSIDTAGKPNGTHGMVQEIEVQGIKVRIHFAEFGSNEEAHQSARFYTNNVASVFQVGLWEGEAQTNMGDEVWSSQSGQASAVLLRTDKTCALVSCHGSDTEKRKSVAVILSQQIVLKAGRGARVPSDRNFRKN